MYKKLLGLLLVALLVGCDSGGSSSGGYTPQPTVTTRTVSCPTCGGAGGAQNPYTGEIYVCSGCNGSGLVTVSTSGGSSQPTFTGGGHCEACASSGYHCNAWAGSPSHGGTCGRKVAAGVYCTHDYTAHHRGY